MDVGEFFHVVFIVFFVAWKTSGSHMFMEVCHRAISGGCADIMSSLVRRQASVRLK